MSLFLDEKTKEEKAKKFWGENYNPNGVDHCGTEESYLAGWNECEKHVGEVASIGFDASPTLEVWARIEYRRPLSQVFGDRARAELDLLSSLLRESYQVAKLSSLTEIEMLSKETAAWKKQCIETEKESKARGEKIQSLESQLAEKDKRIKELEEEFQRMENVWRERYDRDCLHRESKPSGVVNKKFFDAKIQSLEYQLKERDEALIDLANLHDELDGAVLKGARTPGNPMVKHQSLINQIKESRK